MKRFSIPSVLPMLLAFFLFSCGKELSQETGFNTPTSAKGSVSDSVSNCSGTISGTWYNGVAPTDTNFVTVNVDVTTVGSYSIGTNTVNGMSFSGTGTFTNTGLNKVKLLPTGVFQDHLSSAFTYTFDNTSCTLNINVQDSTGHSTGGTDTSAIAADSWTFTANGHNFNGPAVAVFGNAGPQGFVLLISGTMASGSIDTAFSLTIQFADSNLVTGNYVTSKGFNSVTLVQSSGSPIFTANQSTPPVVTIQLTSYDAATKVVTGNFSGNVYDFNSVITPLTKGKFSASLP